MNDVSAVPECFGENPDLLSIPRKNIIEEPPDFNHRIMQFHDLSALDNRIIDVEIKNKSSGLVEDGRVFEKSSCTDPVKWKAGFRCKTMRRLRLSRR
jgi:hypothetical protein